MTAASATSPIAIIGMALRVPGADSPEGFWQNLAAGRESISKVGGPRPARSPAPGPGAEYVPFRGVIADPGLLDAGLFRMSVREAQLTDPQQRVLLECGWEALEHAGYAATDQPLPAAVFAGADFNGYLLSNVLASRPAPDGPELLALKIANEKDHVATRLAYALNLCGPAVAVQTSCSTSLVAVHLACQSLRAGDADMALAGGVSIALPQEAGHFFHPEGIMSRDGHCRAFAADATGTVAGSGAGLVVLKRLTDALADQDTVHAVILGSAIGNDGTEKMGYAAPGIPGQARVIRRALAASGVDPSEVDFVETHGTGTQLGDAVEIAALAEAFAGQRPRRRPCLLHSVKPNIGHLSVAAGVTSLIAAALAVASGQVPPSLHCERPNPQLPFGTDFEVSTELRDWAASECPLTAGVSSFGLGGTNAHLVIRGPSPRRAGPPAGTAFILPLSARTESALAKAEQALVTHLADHPGLDTGDAAFTLQHGRAQQHCRQALVGTRDGRVSRVVKRPAPVPPRPPRLGFMFPGQGTPYPGMARELYDEFAEFRDALDACCYLLRPDLSTAIRDVLLGGDDDGQASPIDEIWLSQPLLFAAEYALAALLMGRWGLVPDVLLGHSLGEQTAVAVARGWDLATAVGLAVARGALMERCTGGAMIAARLDEASARRYLRAGAEIAAVNSPSGIVFSGPAEAMQSLDDALGHDQVLRHRLRIPLAAHSAAVDPVIEEFRALARAAGSGNLAFPVAANVSGLLRPRGSAVSPDYWADQLRRPIRFGECVTAVATGQPLVLLEVGPGDTLTGAVRSSPEAGSITAAPTMPQRDSADGVVETLLAAVSRAWCAGVAVRWPAPRPAGRIPLPTYPFERQRYWLDPPARSPDGEAPAREASPPAPEAVPAPPDAIPARAEVYALGCASLAEIWEALLGVRPEPADDFFDLGGDSLVAMRMCARIQADLGVTVNTSEIFGSESFADLCDIVLARPPAPDPAPGGRPG